MGKYIQGGRLLELATPLGPDILLARSFSCTERISGLYSVEIAACTEAVDAASVKADKLIGQRAFVRVQGKDDTYRFFHGIVRHNPPSLLISRVPVACSTDPAPKNSSALNAP